MIDLKAEELLRFAIAAKLVPAGRSGKPLHPSTIARWAFRGCKGIRLEAIRIGATWYTSSEAIQRFAEQLTVKEPAFPVNENPRNCAAESASQELERLGL